MHDGRSSMCLLSFFFNDTATTEIYTLSLHDALPISINFNEGALAARAEVVNGASDELFAGAGFAEDQNRSVARRREFNLSERTFDGGAFADNFLEIEFATNFLFQIMFFDGQFILQRIDFLEREGILHG